MRLLPFAVVVVASSITTLGAAQPTSPPPPPPPPPDDAGARVESLGPRIRTREAARPATEEGQRGPATPSTLGIVALEGEHASLRLRPVLQADGRFFTAGGVDTFLARRVRPAIEATLFERFDLRITPELAQPAPSVVDAYGNVRVLEELQLRAGKFKAPVGLERNQADQDLALVERGLVTALVPDREIGVMVWGSVLGGTIVYGGGVFDGALDGAQSDGDDDDRKDLEGRVLVRPFARTAIEALKELTVGVAATSGSHGGALPGYKTAGQNPFFTYAADATAGGREQRLVPQACWYFGPVGLLAEYARVHEVVARAGGSTGVNLQAFTAIATVIVTGERASYGTVRPRRAFDPERGGWGALELDLRLSGFRADANTFDWPAHVTDPTRSARRAFEWAVGAQWHFAPAIKLVVDHFHTAFSGGAVGGDRQSESVFIGRLQIAY